jgi:hypothetical protein
VIARWPAQLTELDSWRTGSTGRRIRRRPTG